MAYYNMKIEYDIKLYWHQTNKRDKKVVIIFIYNFNQREYMQILRVNKRK